jgi:hypothetical protein
VIIVILPSDPGPATANGNSFNSAQGSESFIWSLNADTRQLILSWVNQDGSRVPATLVYRPNNKALVITGDAAEFQTKLGNAPVLVSTPSFLDCFDS